MDKDQNEIENLQGEISDSDSNSSETMGHSADYNILYVHGEGVARLGTGSVLE